MEIEYFEKPGCINGEKQKHILRQAGHTLRCVNILTYPWTEETLLPFIEGKSAIEIMNGTAPAIKNGEIDPAGLSFAEAMRMMSESPILIRRPLIRIDGMHIQGFTDERLLPYLGGWDGLEDVITCPNLQTVSCDEQMGRKH